MNQGGCIVLKSDEYAHQHIGNEESGCFYYDDLPLGKLVSSVGDNLVARAARIEVKDTEVDLHQHKGAVVAFITAGNGRFLTKIGEVKVKQGDIIYIPEMTPHLSIADKGTVMIEHIVYIAPREDWQESVPV